MPNSGERWTLGCGAKRDGVRSCEHVSSGKDRGSVARVAACGGGDGGGKGGGGEGGQGLQRCVDTADEAGVSQAQYGQRERRGGGP